MVAVNKVAPNASRIDRATVALVVIIAVLAAALIFILFFTGPEDVGITVPPTTTSTSVGASVENSGVEPTDGSEFVMPLTFLGSWVSADGAATASFSEMQLLTLVAELSAAPLDGRLTLARPAGLDRVPTRATPSSSVLTLELELNGIVGTMDALAVFAPTDECLGVEFDLDVEPSDFDLLGEAVRVPVYLCLIPEF